MSQKIIALEWDNARGEEHNGKSLIIGQFLPRATSADTHLQVYGISLGIADSNKDYRLKRYGLHSGGIAGDILPDVNKNFARAMLHAKIEEILEIMYDETEMEAVNKEFNHDPEDAILDEEE